MAKGRGGGETPERVVDLLKKAVSETSQSAVARATGLTQSAVHRYMKGIGEPSQETLEKLAVYFGVSVAWLRGGHVGPLERFLEGLKIAGINSKEFNERMSYERGEEGDHWRDLLCGRNYIFEWATDKSSSRMFPPINRGWIFTGFKPTVLTEGEIVGAYDAEKEFDKVLGVNNDEFREQQIRYIVTAAKLATDVELNSMVEDAKWIIEKHHS